MTGFHETNRRRVKHHGVRFLRGIFVGVVGLIIVFVWQRQAALRTVLEGANVSHASKILDSMPSFQSVQEKIDFLAKLLDVDGSKEEGGCVEIDIHFNGWIRQFDCHESKYFARHAIPQRGLDVLPFAYKDSAAPMDPRGIHGKGTMKEISNMASHLPHTFLPGPGGHMLQFYGWRLDTIAYELFFSYPTPKTNGVFVEFGAEDGVKVSNTIFFEKYVGWTGLLVEPAASCCGLLQKFRPDSIIENHGVCTEGQSIGNVFSCGGAKDPPATCKPLQELLDKHSIRHVDFMTVDCEGCELDAIKTIDWSRTTVDVLVLEWRPQDGTTRSDYLKQFGYDVARVPFYEVNRVGKVTDEFFWHKERVQPFTGRL